ncbi:MAG: hypothetical protein U1C70_02425 [Sediminibacterium sp.]|uniref:hypothetical protein n=1 Tax=Sediminibacterium sp. TaxID=1917865 RepID=UPI002AB9B42D|nr:hypothetical protein [Sediminibacterium sp.]MDZ4070656.1 hypothetical protein [Sediminibacterium sp.]
MDTREGWLAKFYETIAEDTRINATLISVYVAIVFEGLQQGWDKELEIKRSQVMERSKINSFTTYQKCMHALHEFGYIRYLPQNGNAKSIVYLRKL